jgi:hypothetical protein
MLHMPCQIQEMHKGNYTYATKELPNTQLKKSNIHLAPPACGWKLLDLGVWWKYRLVGHVWVHGSKLSFLSLRCLSKMIPHFFVLGFGMEHWVLCNAYGTGGVCDPKELRSTTSSGNVLCLGSGLSNTRLFAGTPGHQRRSQKLASPRSGLPIQPTPGKIRIWKTTKC